MIVVERRRLAKPGASHNLSKASTDEIPGRPGMERRRRVGEGRARLAAGCKECPTLHTRPHMQGLAYIGTPAQRILCEAEHLTLRAGQRRTPVLHRLKHLRNSEAQLTDDRKLPINCCRLIQFLADIDTEYEEN